MPKPLAIQLVKEGLLYASYVQATTQINRFLRTKMMVLEEGWFYPEFENYIDDDTYIPPATFQSKILKALCDSISKEEPDEMFQGLIEHIEYNMAERNFDTHIAGLFYFGSLFNNLHYFTHNEQLTWLTKLEEVFMPFNNRICKQYSHFYELNFKFNFFNGQAAGYQKYYEQMRYAYVLFYSYEDAVNEITPSTIQKFVEFAFRYVEFYKELTLELELKRQVKIA